MFYKKAMFENAASVAGYSPEKHGAAENRGDLVLIWEWIKKLKELNFL